MKKLPVLVAGATAAVAAVATTLTLGLGTAEPSPRPTPSRSLPIPPAATPHAAAVDAANRHGLRVWLEADLVKRWQAGPESLNEAAMIVGGLARRKGVVGIKIADEIGYRDGLDSPAKVRKFLTDARAALRRTAPGKPVLVDAIVPELGCMPNYQPPLRWATICAAQARGRYPQLALDEFDSYVREGFFDILDLSTGLLPDRAYGGWGVEPQTAQRTAWSEVRRRGWDKHVRLQSRKALAHPGPYTASDTDQTMDTFVDTPLAEGATAVDVWTWRQVYQGQVYRLLDPGLGRNALWQALVERRSRGVTMFTHLSPRSLEVGLDADLEVITEAFTDLFVAAGTG